MLSRWAEIFEPFTTNRGHHAENGMTHMGVLQGAGSMFNWGRSLQIPGCHAQPRFADDSYTQAAFKAKCE
jgi:hypothetical protein